MSAVTTWSLSPSSNNSAPPNGYPEGMAAASLNDSLRQLMSDVVREFQVNAVIVLASVAGTNTITGSMTPDLASYSTGMMVIFTPANNSTGAATINIDSLGAKSIVKGDGTALESGDLQASTVHFLIYDGTNFVLINPLSFSLVNGTLSGTLSVGGALTLGGNEVVRSSSGTYSPTATSELNLDATPTAYTAQYLRVGDVVTVSGQVSVDPTSAATLTRFRMTLPIASNIGSALIDCAGTAIDSNGVDVAGMYGSPTNDAVVMQWTTADTASHVMSYTYTYRIA